MSFVIEGPNSSADVRNESDKMLREMYLNHAILKDRNQFLDWMKLQSMRIIYPDKIEQPKKASIDTMKPVQPKYNFSKSEKHANLAEIDINNEELRTPNMSNLEKLSKIRMMFQSTNESDSNLTPNRIALSKSIQPLPSVNECKSNYNDQSLKSPKSSHSSSYDKENIHHPHHHHHPTSSKCKLENTSLTDNEHHKNETSTMISSTNFQEPQQAQVHAGQIREKSQNQTMSKEGTTPSTTDIPSNNNSVTFSSSLDQYSPSTQSASSDYHPYAPSSASQFIDSVLNKQDSDLTTLLNDNQSTLPAVEHASHTKNPTPSSNADINMTVTSAKTTTTTTTTVVLDSVDTNNNNNIIISTNNTIAPPKISVIKPTPTIPPLPLSFNALQTSTAPPPSTAPARAYTATVPKSPEKSVANPAVKLEVPSLSSKTKEYLDSLLVEKESYSTTNKSPTIVYSSDYVRYQTPSKEDSLVEEDLAATVMLPSPRVAINTTPSSYNYSSKIDNNTPMSLTSGATGSGSSKENKSGPNIRVDSGRKNNTESVAWYLQSPRELDTPRKLALEADLSSLRTRDFAQFTRPTTVTVHYRSSSPSKSNGAGDNLNTSRNVSTTGQQGHINTGTSTSSTEVDLSDLTLEKIKILTGHY